MAKPPPTLSELLSLAHERIEYDVKRAEQLTGAARVIAKAKAAQAVDDFAARIKKALDELVR